MEPGLLSTEQEREGPLQGGEVSNCEHSIVNADVITAGKAAECLPMLPLPTDPVTLKSQPSPSSFRSTSSSFSLCGFTTNLSNCSVFFCALIVLSFTDEHFSFYIFS
jgi:hypothetical protein